MPQSFALLLLQLLSLTSTLVLYTADCTGTFSPLSDWPQIALGPLHAIFNNTIWLGDGEGKMGRGFDKTGMGCEEFSGPHVVIPQVGEDSVVGVDKLV